MSKVKGGCTELQRTAVWAERIALENHHEAALPSSRYRYTRLLPPKLNPIVPQDVEQLYDGSSLMPAFPPSFLELNAPRQRPPVLGNPLFGFSCHPIPAPVKPDASGKSGHSAAAAAKLAELQDKLNVERGLRAELEAKLAMRYGK